MVKEHYIDLSNHRSRIFNQDEAKLVAAIFVMDRRNYHDLMAQCHWARHKIYFLGLFADDDFIEIGLSGTRAVIKVDYDKYQEQLFIASRYIKDYINFGKLGMLEYLDVRFAGQIIVKETKA